jgi:AcrR family transcriptional regulator
VSTKKVEKKNRKPKPGRQTGRTSRRDQILSATEKLMRSRGLSGVTTRQIAETAGCSEGAIYVHFKGRVDLFIAVLEESLPRMLEPLHMLKTAIGRDSPEENLERAIRGIFSFQQRVTPMLASLFAEPALLAGLRKSLARDTSGPHKAIAKLAEYIRSEQAIGRLGKGIDADTAAALLMSASFFRAFTENFFGKSIEPGSDVFFKQVVASVISAVP